MKKVKEINGFKLYNKKPNTISKGALYIKEIYVDVNNEDKKRFNCCAWNSPVYTDYAEDD